jgi:heme-degrading monooxygenase HmoA
MMYAAIRIYSQAEGLADAVSENRAEIVDLIEGVPGFRGYYMLRTGAASAASITVYEDQAGAEASIQIASDWIAANLSSLAISPPQVLVGEVAMSA